MACIKQSKGSFPELTAADTYNSFAKSSRSSKNPTQIGSEYCSSTQTIQGALVIWSIGALVMSEIMSLIWTELLNPNWNGQDQEYRSIWALEKRTGCP